MSLTIKNSKLERCRICLSKEEKAISLYEGDNNEKVKSFADVVATCCGVEVFPGDGKPNKICQNCLDKANLLLKFQEIYKLSDNILTAEISNAKKFEINEEDTDEDPLEITLTTSEKCRICISKKGTISLHEYTENEVEAIDYLDVLLKFCGVTISQDDEKPQVICLECSEISKALQDFRTEWQLSDELLDLELNSHHQCKHCEKLFFDEKQLKNHNKNFHSSHLLNKELYVCDATRPYGCPTCGKYFKSKRYLYEHKKRHTNILHKCEKCERMFKTRQDMKNHFLRIHMNNGISRNITLTPINQEVFKNKPAPQDLKQQSYKCKDCGKVFSLLKQLNSHSVVHNDARPYACEICGKRFKLKLYVKIHKATHRIVNSYPCGKCGKMFKSRQYLTSHFAHMHKEKKFKCNICEKSFSFNYALKMHMKSHIKNFVCFTCGKGFAYENSLRRHERCHENFQDWMKEDESDEEESNNDNYKCDVCTESFVKKDDLMIHINMQHI